MTKIWRVWLKNWVCHALLNFKIKMGVVGSIFELHPPNFVKIHIFWISTNDSKTIFCWLCCHRIWKKDDPVLRPGVKESMNNLNISFRFKEVKPPIMMKSFEMTDLAKHRLLYTWTEDWIIFFPNSIPAKSAQYGFTIICRYSKDMYFHKIWRM